MDGILIKFLIIDEDGDGRRLISRTLLRNFPRSAIVECADGPAALKLVATEPFTAVIVHRAGEMDGEALVRGVRAANSGVPVIWMSGYERLASATKAGANRFLNYDEWLIVGKVVEEVLKERDSRPE